jgi:putative tricarboxylic transport membrane protein
MRLNFLSVAPVILVICAVGAYTVHSSMFDVWLMLVFGVMGYVFKKLNYPLAPLVLALVLGDMAENAFRQSLLGSGGSLMVFVSNPLVGSITGLAMVMLLWPFIGQLLGKMRRRPKDIDDDDVVEV